MKLRQERRCVSDATHMYGGQMESPDVAHNKHLSFYFVTVFDKIILQSNDADWQITVRIIIGEYNKVY